MSKLWGGRYKGVTDELMWRFNASIGFDIRLAAVDIRGSQAYAAALQRAGVLTDQETTILVAGLTQVAEEIERDVFQVQPADEDVHTAVERRLGELVGAVAGKLHTGRSRNDQVATDVRLFMLAELESLSGLLRAAQEAILSRADQHIELLMPGYTHLQPAQPVRFSHWLLSYFWMLERDYGRLQDARRRIAICPLGAGALAGNAYGIDREALAADLGFDSVTQNSMDAVSDRDMVVEVLAAAAILGTHLSRLAEDLILYSSVEYGFVTLAERYTTGSSIMPQKRNPDSMELVRGKTGRLIGNLMQLLVVIKGIPSSYDKDLQEDKEALFDTLDTLAMTLPIVAGVVETLKVNPSAMGAALGQALLATDLADYLVKRGLAFREAHGLVGKAVLMSEERGVELGGLSVTDYQALSEHFGDDVLELFNMEASVESRDVVGGTALKAVRDQIARGRELLLGQ